MYIMLIIQKVYYIVFFLVGLLIFVGAGASYVKLSGEG